VTDKEIVRVELDRHRQTADRDPSDNMFPQQIERSTFAVEPRERGGGGNPMRTAQESTVREATRKAAESLGKRVAEAVKAGRSAGSVLGAGDAADAKSDLKDGWGVSFVVLDGAEQGSGGIAQIISAGPDRAVGGDDDITFIVNSSGDVHERAQQGGRRGGGGRGRGGARGG